MKILSFILILITLSTNIFAVEKKPMTQAKWFEKFGCEKMKITQYESASSRKIIHESTIEDVDYIRLIQGEISQLPTSGDEYIKIGPDSDYLTLDFTCEGKGTLIEFFNKSIKTPATSFYSKSSKFELDVWNQIESHFTKAEIGKLAPKYKNGLIRYDLFTVKYLGSEDKTPKGTTATSNHETFIVTSSKDQTIQTIIVRSGQLPPKPFEFKIGSEEYILSTYSQSKGPTLHPATFIIEKKRP